LKDILAEAPNGGYLSTSKPALLDGSVAGPIVIQTNLFWLNGTSCNCGLGAGFTGSNSGNLIGPAVTNYSGTAFVNASGNNFGLNGVAGTAMKLLPGGYSLDSGSRYW
jgi:hypothetical protein